MSDAPKPEEKLLREALEKNPADWDSRKQLARILYDEGSFQEAADLVWATDEIPSIDLELAFAARVLAKATPRKAIRLLTAVLEHNRGKAVQNLGLANALLHHGMVIQAARFYGAALEADPSLGNPDLEHFILWTDDEETLWGDFQARKPKLGELPWMKRDPKEAMKLTSKVSTHTSPIKVPNLEPAPGEQLKHDLYQQKAEKGAQPTPPPAVTIPMDRVDPKHRRFDPELGAETDAPGEPAADEPAPVATQPVETTPAPAKPSIPTPNFPPPPTVKPAADVPGAPKPATPTEGPKKLHVPAVAPADRPKPSLPPLKEPDAAK
jgi:hypothetical protein